MITKENLKILDHYQHRDEQLSSNINDLYSTTQGKFFEFLTSLVLQRGLTLVFYGIDESSLGNIHPIFKVLVEHLLKKSENFLLFLKIQKINRSTIAKNFEEFFELKKPKDHFRYIYRPIRWLMHLNIIHPR